MSDTAGMWANMLGIGPLLNAINDPNFQHQIKAVVEAITNTQSACARIEMKLDLILEREPAYGRKRLTSIPVDRGSPGTGTNTASGGVADDGNKSVANKDRDVRQSRLIG